MEPYDTMQITATEVPGRVPVTVLHLKGRLNMGTAEILQQEARGAIASGARNLLLDLTGVESLTSAGLRAIHLVHNLLGDMSPDGNADTASIPATHKSRHLKLLAPRPEIRRVLTIAGFDDWIDIQEDVQSAVASFG